MRYTPPVKNGAATVVPLFLFSAAALCVLAAAAGVGYAALSHIIAAACFAAGAEITQRYKLTVYTYIIGEARPEDGALPAFEAKGGGARSDLTLTIIKTQRRRTSTAAILPLRTIKAVYDKKDKKERAGELKKYGHIHIKSYNFCVNLFAPDVKYLIYQPDSKSDKVFEIAFEPDEYLLKFLSPPDEQLNN